jgi:hypothetical protein
MIMSTPHRARSPPDIGFRISNLFRTQVGLGPEGSVLHGYN